MKLAEDVLRTSDVELGGIEPPSAEEASSALRPFPCSSSAAAVLPGQVDPESDPAAGSFPGASGLCLLSAVSPAVHHCFCCRVAVIRPRVASRLALFLELPRD